MDKIRALIYNVNMMSWTQWSLGQFGYGIMLDNISSWKFKLLYKQKTTIRPYPTRRGRLHESHDVIQHG